MYKLLNVEVFWWLSLNNSVLSYGNLGMAKKKILFLGNSIDHYFLIVPLLRSVYSVVNCAFAHKLHVQMCINELYAKYYTA